MGIFQKIFYRALFIPSGFIKVFIHLVNDSARDMENKARYPHAIIDKGCSFTRTTKVGEHSHILKNCILNNSNIGNYTYIGRGSLIQNSTIGNYCSIAHEVILGLGKHPLNLFSTSPLFYRKRNPLNIEIVKKDFGFIEYEPITIGNDVWIGARAIIMDGVKVGDGAVIAAGAIVTKDVAPFSIVGGVPAKVIKYRTSEDRRERNEKQDWYFLSPQEAYKLMSDEDE